MRGASHLLSQLPAPSCVEDSSGCKKELSKRKMEVEQWPHNHLRVSSSADHRGESTSPSLALSLLFAVPFIVLPLFSLNLKTLQLPYDPAIPLLEI
jgi:hypothetical protein